MGLSRKLALALVALLVIWGVGVAPAQASDDTWITTKIRITVDSEAVKDKAEATARAVGGVTDVRNLLQVVKEAGQEWVKAADRDVKDAVENALLPGVWQAASGVETKEK